jgi:hypothetical protein
MSTRTQPDVGLLKALIDNYWRRPDGVAGCWRLDEAAMLVALYSCRMRKSIRKYPEECERIMVVQMAEATYSFTNRPASLTVGRSRLTQLHGSSTGS